MLYIQVKTEKNAEIILNEMSKLGLRWGSGRPVGNSETDRGNFELSIENLENDYELTEALIFIDGEYITYGNHDDVDHSDIEIQTVADIEKLNKA